MHPFANPLVIAWWVRHPESAAIEDNTYYGDSELSELGKQQIPPLARAIKRLKPDLVLCSPMIRTTKVLLQKDVYICKLLQQEEALSEWPRIEKMVGRKNDEPEVEQYLDERIERFVQCRKMLPGEESSKETIEKMLRIERRLIDFGALIRARLNRPARIVNLSHGNRGRHFRAWTRAKGDPKEFRREFRRLYESEGLEPAAIMGPFWYGNFFRSSDLGWNFEAGTTLHLPRNVRNSLI